MEKKRNFEDEIMRFIVRRAFRHGSVSRAELLRAVGNISSATATRLMSNAIAKLGSILERKGHDVVPALLAECPPYAGVADFLESIDSGKRDAISTGLFEDELPVTYVSWTNSMPARPETLETIMTAIQRGKQIDIVYVGLKTGQSPQARKIQPLGLEKMNDQWRVVAQDLESRDFPIKVFVLPRIMSASMSVKNIRIPYVKGHTDSQTKMRVSLNHRYNARQKQVLEHELKINDGEVTVAMRSLHEFKRRFADTPVSEDVIWPPLVIKEM